MDLEIKSYPQIGIRFRDRFREPQFVANDRQSGQFDCKRPPEPPPLWTLRQGFQHFLDPHLCLQVQVLRTQKVSLDSEKVDVNSGMFLKESPNFEKDFYLEV